MSLIIFVFLVVVSANLYLGILFHFTLNLAEVLVPRLVLRFQKLLKFLVTQIVNAYFMLIQNFLFLSKSEESLIFLLASLVL